MLRLRGSQAYSDFRIKKLRAHLSEYFKSITDIRSQYQHLVKLKEGEELSRAELDKVGKLLTYGPIDNNNIDELYQNPKTVKLYVVPRIGTISP